MIHPYRVGCTDPFLTVLVSDISVPSLIYSEMTQVSHSCLLELIDVLFSRPSLARETQPSALFLLLAGVLEILLTIGTCRKVSLIINRVTALIQY